MFLSTATTRLAGEVTAAVMGRVAALVREGREVIDLSVGEPDFPTPPHIVEAGVRALRDGHHGYTPAPGLPALREAVAADLATRWRATVEPDRIVIVPGSKVALFFALLAVGEPGAEILCPDPGFPIFRSVIDYTGATAVSVPLAPERGFRLEADAVLARITPRTRLLILNSPANPTGAVAPRGELDRLVDGLAAHPQVAVLSDEIYSSIVYDGHEAVSLLRYEALADRLIVVDGWSKRYAMPGWRLGYGVWPQALVDTVVRLAVNSYSCATGAAQHAGIAALTGPQGAVATMVAEYARRRRAVVDALATIPGVRCHAPGGAFYAFPEVAGTGHDAEALPDRLLAEAGVATVAGTGFGPRGHGHLRLSFANSRTDTLIEAVERMRTLLGESKGALLNA